MFFCRGGENRLLNDVFIANILHDNISIILRAIIINIISEGKQFIWAIYILLERLREEVSKLISKNVFY